MHFLALFPKPAVFPVESVLEIRPPVLSFSPYDRRRRRIFNASRVGTAGGRVAFLAGG